MAEHIHFGVTAYFLLLSCLFLQVILNAFIHISASSDLFFLLFSSLHGSYRRDLGLMVVFFVVY